MKRGIVILPSAERILVKLGANIKLARLRRRLTTEQVAERADISRATLWQVEKGAPVLQWVFIVRYSLFWGSRRTYSKLLQTMNLAGNYKTQS